MSITSGFFNSVNHDRVYDALQFSSVFDGIINDGIYMGVGKRFVVRPGAGYSIIVGSGRGWFNHTWILNDADMPMDMLPAEAILNRIDAVVIKVDRDDYVREDTVEIIKGTPATNPVKPVLQNDGDTYYYPLAYIYVEAGARTITQANIENAVGTSATPFVTGVIQTMNIDTLIAQWQAQWQEYIVAREEAMDTWTDAEKASFQSWEQDTKDEIDLWYSTQQTAFNTWFEGIRGILDEDVAGHLQNEIDGTFTDVTNDEANDRLIFTRVDSTTVPVTISGGHKIENSSGTQMPKRKSLQFTNTTVTDDATNDRIVVQGFSGSYKDLSDKPFSSGTSGMTDGVTPLETGTLYLQYE